VVAATAVYDALCVNGLLQRGADNSLTLTAPHFRDEREQQQWLQATAGADNANSNNDGAQQENAEGNNDWWKQQQEQGEKQPKKAIEDASTFLSMTVGEKREWIRRYGGLPSYRIPRPREGSRALDAAILPLLDVETTYEVPHHTVACTFAAAWRGPVC